MYFKNEKLYKNYTLQDVAVVYDWDQVYHIFQMISLSIQIKRIFNFYIIKGQHKCDKLYKNSKWAHKCYNRLKNNLVQIKSNLRPLIYITDKPYNFLYYKYISERGHDP